MELPSLATRTWFHALGDTVVGGSELFEIRARQGEVTFVPGVRDASGSVQAGEALRFRTVRIGRDGAADNVAPAQEAVGGALQIRHQAATERWVNRLDAAEQSFVFPQALPGDGDLVVEIATTGLECAESTTAGLRFIADDGLSGVLYGHGTFIDAAGRATPVPAVCSERGISLRVPADVAEDASYPAVLDPLVSPSFPLTPPIPESANGDLPSVACSDTVCMMVFVDSRDGTYRRYAGRFTPDGTILDQTPPVLGGVQAVQQGQASVAHVADRFFVAYRDGSTVFGQLIGENGALLSPPITVATGAATTDRPRVGCDAAGCLVTWLQGADLLVANRVALDGTVLDGAGFVVASPASATYDIVTAGARHFVPYKVGEVSFSAVYAKRVEGNVVLDPAPIVVTSTGFNPDPVAIATNGTDFLVTAGWGTLQQLHATFISNGGALLPPGPNFEVLGLYDARSDAVVWTGQKYAALYQPLDIGVNLASLGITSSGVVDPVRTTLWTGPQGATFPRVTAAPLPSGAAVVVRRNDSLLAGRLHALKLDDLGQPDGDWFAVSHGYNNQFPPAVAAGVGQYLVAWIDRRLASAYVVGTRVAADGTILDPNGIVIAELDPNNDFPLLSTAGVDAIWNGSSFLVVWTDQTTVDSRGLKAARIASDGTLLDAAPNTVATAPARAMRPSLAWSGSTHMVTWKNSATTPTVYVARIGLNGVGLDPAGIAIGSMTSATQPLITWTGTEFMVIAGPNYRTLNANGVPLQGAAVAHDAGIAPYSMSCAGTSCSFTGFSPPSQLRSVPFNAATKVAGAPVTILFGADRPSATVWDGARFLVVHGTDDLTAWTVNATPAPVESSPNLANAPDLASLASGQSLVAYQLRDAPGSVARVYASLIAGGAPTGTACVVAADCGSGFCTDGVCCDSACNGANTTDCQACSVAAGAAVNGICGPRTAGILCRDATGVCDAAEVCDGINPSCPANAFLTGTECRPSTGACDAAEVCSGSSTQCPSNALSPAGTVCRASVGSCDVADTCNGSSASCPADAALPVGASCAGPPNDCVIRSCSGTVGATATCLATPKLAGTLCRAPSGSCDVAELCDGSGSPCPTDALQPAGSVCRLAGGVCDVAEACDGVTSACPADELIAAGTECRPVVSECDVAESCSGVTAACPIDLGASWDTVCGDAPAGPCQLVSTCGGGASKECQLNFLPAGATCRDAEDACDAEEACDGASAQCPDDQILEAGEVCNDKLAGDDCDADDVCDGVGLACPSIEAADGTPCTAPGGADGQCDAGACVEGAGGVGGSGGAEPSTTSGTGAMSSSTGTGGSNATTGGGGSGGPGGGVDDGKAGAEDGCSCRSAERASGAFWAPWVVMALAAWRRRSKALAAADRTRPGKRPLRAGLLLVASVACGGPADDGGGGTTPTSTTSTGGAPSSTGGAGGGTGGGGSGGTSTTSPSSSSGMVTCEEVSPVHFTDDGFTNSSALYSSELEPQLFGGASDFIGIQLFGSAADDPGSYDLAAPPDDDYQTCARCVVLYTDFGTSSERAFFQTSGTFTLDSSASPFDGRLLATIEDLRLVEVTIDPNTFASSEVPGGACLQISSLQVEVGAPAEWSCDPQHYNTLDGCDCGCSVTDPDCTSELPAACEFCRTGSCAESGDGTCTSAWLADDDNSFCVCSCLDQDCGDDGCGNDCGSCASPDVCNPLGECVCAPACGANVCGDDGCGGVCGTCAPNETCTNGACIPGCGPSGTGTCVPLPPLGWAGPIAVHEGFGSPSCPSDYPTSVYTGFGDLDCGTHECSPCACSGTPIGGSCTASPDVTLYENPDCSGFFYHFGGPTSACYEVLGFASGQSGRATIDFATGASCSPGVGGDLTVDAPSWGSEVLLCGGGIEPLGCAASETCAEQPPAPFGGAACIAANDEQDCPAGSPYAVRYVYYTSFEDTRDCAASCSCGATGMRCSNSVNLLDSGEDCFDAGDLLPADNVCHTGPFYAAGFKSTVGSPIEGTGTCAPAGSSTPTGVCEGVGAAGQGAVTVCCL